MIEPVQLTSSQTGVFQTGGLAMLPKRSERRRRSGALHLFRARRTASSQRTRDVAAETLRALQGASSQRLYTDNTVLQSGETQKQCSCHDRNTLTGMSARLLAPVGGQLLRSSNRRDRLSPGRVNLSVQVAANPVASAALSETRRLCNPLSAAVSGAERLAAPETATAREAADWREWQQFFQHADAQDRLSSTLQVRFCLPYETSDAVLRRSCVQCAVLH